MKKFLLMAGASYYPQGGTEDWIRCFETYEEAKSQVKIEQVHDYYLRGPRKGQIKETHTKSFINGYECDWYNIINLQEWMDK
jgi:hypothetical protein